MASSAWAIEMSEIGKRYGRHWVLAHIDLQVKCGESVALFGGNGSGKSTLLKLVATLLAPSTGNLQVLGDDLREPSQIRGSLRYLAHEKQLYSRLTVMENLRIACGLRGVAAGADLPPLIARFGLAPYRDRKIAELSEGLKKRVVLARLVIGSPPRLVLLDEPHPTLDTEGKKILEELIREWRRQGTTLVIASHDHQLALRYVDRTIFLRDGIIRYDGPPQAVEAS